MPFRRHREGGDICAIFVHAGAGYHSYTNEKYHLAACQDAAKVAMTVLKAGGVAVDAVEMAIRVLEDREITNAGYGSNLALDGTVECDATIVDHYGRSGAVGAVAQVKNPIGLARLVLDESTKPLSLQRVPPNLLVGQGATDFAYDNGIAVLPHDFLVSPAAKERWLRWQQDLQIAEEREMRHSEAHQTRHSGVYAFDHGHVEGFSPPTSPNSATRIDPGLARMADETRPLVASTADFHASFLDSNGEHATHPMTSGKTSAEPVPNPNIDGMQQTRGDDSDMVDETTQWKSKRPRISDSSDGSFDNSDSPLGQIEARAYEELKAGRVTTEEYEDRITDTVGAVAVDCFGNIAAGSSSGGIGMKHRGRTGPAALVGIGTAVIPVDPDDPERVCVATVTSGTGEHMATTMAAATCADRIYSSVRKITGGSLTKATEDEAMRSVIEKEFMAHPGVRNSHCAGAIGVMAVKKTREGIFLYFGHNTDSFALASMHSEERKPVCTMSRSTGNGTIAQGGRAAKYRRHH